MAMRVSIQARPLKTAGLGKGALAVARELAIGPTEARGLLLARPGLPAALDEAAAQRLVTALGEAGFEAMATAGPARATARCATHPVLDSEGQCPECRATICAACLLSGPRCSSCRLKQGRRRRFRNARVAVLLVVLGGVAAFGTLRNRRLDARTQWIRTVAVSVVLVADRPVSEAARARWATGLDLLQGWFGREWERYRPASPVPMVTLTLDGVAQVAALPVAPGKAEALTDRARESLGFSAALEAIDAKLAPHAPTDATLYVILRPGGGGVVEGVAEAGGRIGMVEGPLEEGELALELTAIAHEVLHCLGAKDKYDPQGHALVPDGLAEPGLAPRYPQTSAEVMVGEIPTGPGAGKPLTKLGDVRVGPATAREIRW